MKNMGMVVKVGNPEAVKLGCEIADWFKGQGCKVYVETALAELITPAEAVPPGDLKDTIDVMVVLGGDGTMLYAARLLDGSRTPMLGVNMGGLGFLTVVKLGEMYPLLERIVADDCTTEERMMLSVEVEREGTVIASHRVLNDVVIKGTVARLIKMETRINKEYVTTYRADGLIVATPTGSTAYSLSAAGPILYPTIHSIIVAPICPFNLTNRPVVIPDWMTVEVSLCPGQTNIVLILDGQVDVGIKCGDTVKMKRARESVYLIQYEGKSYFDILRERLMWEVKIER
jgi:NAD+ kinase